MLTSLVPRLLAVAAALIPAAALAADGFQATATASRRVQADTLTISFHIIERTLPEQQSSTRVEEQRLRDELRKTGAVIQSWSSRVSLMNSGINTSGFNFINPSSREPQAVDIRRDITARVTGLTDAEAVAAVLGRNNIRNGLSFAWTSSQADTVRDELLMEAAAAAVDKARRVAARVGGKSGNVTDLRVVSPSSRPISTTFVASGMVMNDVVDGGALAPPDQIIEDASGLGLIVRATVAVTLQARPD